MSDLKFEILLFYYDRPAIVQKFALPSVFESTYPHWSVTLIDDSSSQGADLVVREFFEKNPHYLDRKDKVKLIKTGDTLDTKVTRGESIFGMFANIALEKHSDADICVTLCDDDGIIPDYFEKLNKYYLDNPDVIYSYCSVARFNPMKVESFKEVPAETSDHYINKTHDINNAFCEVDSSQVSWRIKDFIEDGVKFPYPRTVALDAYLFLRMHELWGKKSDCCFNNIIGQYKGVFDDQLGRREQRFITVEGS